MTRVLHRDRFTVCSSRGANVVQECFETSDRSEINQFLHAQHTKDDALKSIKEVLQAARQRLQAKRRKTGTASTGRLRKPVAFPSDVVWTESAAMKYVPARGRIRKDVFNGCWRANYGSKWTRARSWGKHGGDAECIRQLCQQLWEQHTSVTGEECDVAFG